MYDQIKRDILSVLEQLVDILRVKEEKDVSDIKQLSNKVIHNASVFQDEDSVSVAVLVYSLSKLIERNRTSLDYKKLAAMVNSPVTFLKNNDEIKFRKAIQQIFDFIRAMDKKLKMYIYEVINQAQIKKGCKLCEHGISVARASEVFGISQWELMHYIGQTTVIDHLGEPLTISKR